MLAGMALGGSELIGPELVGLVVAISFAAGLNVYATVATLGLLAGDRSAGGRRRPQGNRRGWQQRAAD
jgi:hypothetical protein